MNPVFKHSNWFINTNKKTEKKRWNEDSDEPQNLWNLIDSVTGFSFLSQCNRLLISLELIEWYWFIYMMQQITTKTWSNYNMPSPFSFIRSRYIFHIGWILWNFHTVKWIHFKQPPMLFRFFLPILFPPEVQYWSQRQINCLCPVFFMWHIIYLMT